MVPIVDFLERSNRAEQQAPVQRREACRDLAAAVRRSEHSRSAARTRPDQGCISGHAASGAGPACAEHGASLSPVTRLATQNGREQLACLLGDEPQHLVHGIVRAQGKRRVVEERRELTEDRRLPMFLACDLLRLAEAPLHHLEGRQRLEEGTLGRSDHRLGVVPPGGDNGPQCAVVSDARSSTPRSL